MKATENTVAFSSGGDSGGRLESEDLPKRPRGASKGDQRHLKSGIHAVTKLVKKLGADRSLDKRTAMAKALERWRQELINDLGGNDNISAQQRAIIDLAVKNKLILDSIDRWIFQQPSLIDKRKRALLPLCQGTTKHANGLAEYMDRLGLERTTRR